MNKYTVKIVQNGKQLTTPIHLNDGFSRKFDAMNAIADLKYDDINDPNTGLEPIKVNVMKKTKSGDTQIAYQKIL